LPEGAGGHRELVGGHGSLCRTIKRVSIVIYSFGERHLWRIVIRRALAPPGGNTMDTTLDRLTGLIAIPVPVNASAYQLPAEVRMEQDDDGWLLAWRGVGKQRQVGAGTERLLTDFMRLQDSEPGEIANFAANWGALTLCKHGKPQSHLPRRLWSDLDELDAAPCDVIRAYPDGWRREPVARWRHYASQAEAINRLARNLKSNRPTLIEDLHPLKDLFPDHIFDRSEPAPEQNESDAPEFSRAEHERVLAVAIHAWLGMGDVGFHVTWRNEKSSLRFGGTNLFGALALQLALVSTGVGALIICSECKLPYNPERMPRAGELNYCFDCREAGIDARNRQRARRSRRRAERSAGT
jgi:hypothetical protein